MKRMISVVLAVILLLSMCACGAQKGETKMTEAMQADKMAAVPFDLAEKPASAATFALAEEQRTTPASGPASPGSAAPAESETSVPVEPATSAPAESATPAVLPVSAESPFLPAETVRTLWDTFGLEKTASETLQEALSRGDIIVTKNSDIIAGRDRLLAFTDATHQSECGEILVLNYYDLVGVRCGVEFFNGEGADYPVAYLTRVGFDGEQYYFAVRGTSAMEIEQGAEGSFRYLMHYEGKTTPPARPFLYEHFVLVDDDTLTWDRIEWGMLSSQFGDAVPHHNIATRLYTEASEQPGAYVPTEEERPLWYRIDGKETWNTHFAKANLDSERAVTLFAPQTDAQGMLSYWESGRILWRAELPYSVEYSCPTDEGILIHGVQYSKTSVLPQVNYLEHYDTGGKLLWQWKEAAAGAYRHLLGAGEKDGELTCVFRGGNLYASDPKQTNYADIWTFDGEGKRTHTYRVALPAGSMLAASVNGTSENWPMILLAVQESGAGTAGIYLLSEGMEEAQRIIEIPAGLAPDGKVMEIRDILEQDGTLYISAYFCTAYEKKYNSTNRDEVQDIIEWGYEQIAAAPPTEDGSFPDLSDEITPMVQARYTAVLFRTPVLLSGLRHQPEHFKTIRTRAGSLGGALGINDQGEVTWEIEEITRVIYSPATSFATLYGSCRVIQYFFQPEELDAERLFDDSPGGYMLLDKTGMYYR
nr:hypothetical protein [Lachnospiraceae bacterium]